MSGEVELAERVVDALARDDSETFGTLADDEIEIETARGVRRGHAEAGTRTAASRRGLDRKTPRREAER